MKIVQTFWSGYKNPLIDDFGWKSPQEHLMSWALSCLSLKENYDEVVLYTDSIGYYVLKELLGLPYTNVILQYDNLSCPEQHWAYPKILTYSLQNQPFIHVDGDVYLPKRLAPVIESSGLIAQNKEIGTPYYKNMVNAIIQSNIHIPSFLNEELKKDSISSYNAGIIGGNDIEFIQRYCQTAFKFINENHLNDMDNDNKNVNLNILFEQILFYVLSQEQHKKVFTVLNRDIRDNGYTYNDFCDFYAFEELDLMHIIGGHKRNNRICELLNRTLLNKYPEYYERIINLFSKKHNRLHCDDKQMIIKDLSVEKNIASYQDYLNSLSIRWQSIPNEVLFDLEKKNCNYLNFLNISHKNKLLIRIKKNPHLSIHEISDNWTFEARQLIKERINKNYYSERFEIACIPSLLKNGLDEILIDDLCYNILLLLKKGRTFKYILENLSPCFQESFQINKSMIRQMIEERVEYLFYNKLIYIETIK